MESTTTITETDVLSYGTESVVESILQEQNGTVSDGQLDDTDEL